MMRLALLAVLGCWVLGAQTTLQVVTGTAGTTCTLVQQPGSTILATLTCISSDGRAGVPMKIESASSAVTKVALGVNEVMCLIGVNPTMGTFDFGIGIAPANGMVWNCTGGPGSILVGTAQW